MAYRSGILASLAAALLLAACSGSGEPPVTLQEASLKNGAPDEFLVLPQRPLTVPEDLETLPEPDPNAGSLVEIDPFVEARKAVGGNGGGTSASAADNAILAAARTVGRTPNIREELAAETDAKLTRGRGILGFFDRFRIAPRKRTAFNDQKLDAIGELKKRQAQGVKTPSIDLSLSE